MPSVRQLFVSPGHNYFGHHGQPAGDHPIVPVESVECVAGRGIVGDRFFDFKPDYKGQITLFSLEVFADLLARTGAPADTPPAAVRRNALVEGIDLNTLVGREFTLGPVRLLGVEECKPCYWMDTAVSPGAESSLKGRGGLRCKILTSGTIRLGDPLLAENGAPLKIEKRPLKTGFAGLLLAGGRSSRMGSDKALLPAADGATPLVADRLRLLGDLGAAPVLLSGRRDTVYPVPRHTNVVHDTLGEGPAAGLLAAFDSLAGAPPAHLLVLAVDMPAVDDAWFADLLAHAAPGLGAVAELDGRLEPLAAVYPAEFAPFLKSRVLSGELALQRIVHDAATAGLIRIVHVPATRAATLVNWNRPDDLTFRPHSENISANPPQASDYGTRRTRSAVGDSPPG